MSFQLIFGDHEIALPLPFEGHIEERLIGLLGKDEDTSISNNELSARIVDVITALIQNQIVPPTDKQLKYAIAIARELSLQLPAEVLQYRDAMKAFLAMHAETYRKRRHLGSS